jgi:hypothetical protein
MLLRPGRGQELRNRPPALVTGDFRMRKPIVIYSGDAVSLYFGTLIFRRDSSHDNWERIVWDVARDDHATQRVPERVQQQLDDIVENPRCHTELVRFPRLDGVCDYIEEFYEIPSTDQYKPSSMEWTVDGLFPRSSLVLLTAPPAGYKTWFALAVAGAVSQGLEFLHRKTFRSPVLYLDRENPVQMILQRRAILKLDDKAFLKIWGNWVDYPVPLIGDSLLERIAQRYKPLIVFDSFLRFHSSEENSAVEMRLVAGKLRKLVSLGATVLLLHHQAKSKGSQYRGSTDILASVDAAFEISKGESNRETVLTLSCFKHRFVVESGLTCKFVLRDGVLQLVDNDQPDNSSAVIEKIKEAISGDPGITQKDIMSRLSLPETNGRKILQEGNDVQWLTKRGPGKTLRYFPKS